ncbi:MAG TPA: GtrA family protein [Xanthobacteraceae bacterium]|nr:GtrA family protein [Xanthobacteraceae bacterium]
MTRVSRSDSARAWLFDAWEKRGLHVKAVTFALVGVVNTVVDYSVFLLARAALTHSAAAQAGLGSLSDFCRCGDATTLTLVVSNLMSWSVAVTGSYVLNSSITFARESGRQLRVSAYATFVLAGVAGLIANTATLLIAAQVFLLPVWLAKALAILASFVVNFALSHFVVFRPRG